MQKKNLRKWINSTDQIYLTTEKKAKQGNRVPCVVNYPKGLPNIHKRFADRQKLPENSDPLRTFFVRNMPIVAFKREKNLNDILVHIFRK